MPYLIQSMRAWWRPLFHRWVNGGLGSVRNLPRASQGLIGDLNPSLFDHKAHCLYFRVEQQWLIHPPFLLILSTHLSECCLSYFCPPGWEMREDWVTHPKWHPHIPLAFQQTLMLVGFDSFVCSLLLVFNPPLSERLFSQLNQTREILLREAK